MMTKGKPWDQKVLTRKEIAFIKTCMKKMQDACAELHAKKKCKIKVTGGSRTYFKDYEGCNQHFHLETGIVHHYPNGFYIE